MSALQTLGPAPRDQVVVGLLQACRSFEIEMPRNLDLSPSGWERSVKIINRALMRKQWTFTSEETQKKAYIGAHFDALLDIPERRLEPEEPRPSEASSNMAAGSETVAAIHKVMVLSMAATDARKFRSTTSEIPKNIVMPPIMGQEVGSEYAYASSPCSSP